ncbi:hypothetical protein [Novosphingobium sp.]|uniref:hypothetical protein n=1 Tax=Novosphingobium sp. TaxID=1874826 RepID=UPI003D0BC82F
MADISLTLSQADQRFAAQAKAASGWRTRVVVMWLVLSVLLLIIDAPMIAAVRFGDPDDALRLIEVRDLLGGQSWFDIHQYRIAAPAGVAMHWSRLVDMPLAGMILVLRPLLGPALAEMVAVVAIPLLTLLTALTLVGRLTAKFFDTETVGIACLVTGIGGPLLFQMTPLRIDHHGWQVVMALAALNGLAARDALRGGLVIGAAMAASLAISIEGLPLTVVFLGVLALRGLIGTAQLPGTIGYVTRSFTGLAAASGALALASAGIFLGTRGLGDLATHCDQISPIHVALFAVVALGTGAIVARQPRHWPIALGALGVIGAATLALYMGVAPQCRGGAFVALDPLVMKFWYEGVGEGMPFWHLPLALAVESIGVPIVGLISIFVLWRSAKRPEERLWWRDHALVLTGALLIGAMLSRASANACGIAAMPTGALILRWIIALRTARPWRRVLGYCGILLALMPPLPVVAWGRVAALMAPTQTANASYTGLPMVSRCQYGIAARALNAMPATDLFLPLDIGPDILVRTHQRVIATGHHRGAAAMHDVIAAFLGTPDEAHAIIIRRHATMIAVCPDIPEPSNYMHDAPNGFMAQLLHGKAPGWLEPVDLAPGSHILFWRVKA